VKRRRAPVALLGCVLLVVALGANPTTPGCGSPFANITCNVPGESLWMCDFAVSSPACWCAVPRSPQHHNQPVCAPSEGLAQSRAEAVVTAALGHAAPGTVVQNYGCTNTMSVGLQDDAPKLETQGPGGGAGACACGTGGASGAGGGPACAGMLEYCVTDSDCCTPPCSLNACN
jgi:hypothetical protein